MSRHNVVPFAKPAAPKGVPTCKTCAHRQRDTLLGDQCALGLSASVMRQHSCGYEGRFWTPKPPSRLGRLIDAIIERIAQ